MTPIISAVVTWLTNKFAGSKAFPAPNDTLSIRLGTGQYEIYFITNGDEAFTAASNIRDKPLHHPALTKHGVIIADSITTANSAQVQSAINSNRSGDASTYLCYLELHEVKKWPNTAP